ncbi:MAG: ice-binding family protein [Imperialibacter sp.]|uniref:ice-binding family protein n=1 Tax=Imperialibacter sp. TaxID=2038411 RepID=UPI003A8935D9
MKTKSLLAAFALVSAVFVVGCQQEDPLPANAGEFFLETGSHKQSVSSLGSVPLGSAADFAVLAGTTVTNDGESVITGNLGVSPGTAITGFLQAPLNNISGPGTVTAGLGTVSGIIYAGGPVAAQAHNDAVIAYNYLTALVPGTVYSGVTQLDGITFTPGVYNFAPSANLQVNGTMYLDFQGNSNAEFVFQTGTTLVTMAGSNIIAINNENADCNGSNVFWAVGSSATVDGEQFIGTVIANTTITMTYGSTVSGSMLALNGAVTMITNNISACNGAGGTTNPPKMCRDFVTGGGWIKGESGSKGHHNGRKGQNNEKATFGVSGGLLNGKYWGNLSFDDHSNGGVKVKSIRVTSYIAIDAVTRQIEGIAKLDGAGTVSYKVTLVDNGEPGRNDSFSLELSNGYSISGTLTGGNIKLHRKCDDGRGRGGRGHDREDYDDKDEREGHKNCGSGSKRG